MPRLPTTPVHTPDELLAGAKHLMESADPVVLRAVVLESITALETFVHQRVFAALRERLDPLLVRWLEDRTRMDFDARLSVLTPVATGLPVDQQAELWSRYKRAKTLRNQVTHSGRRISASEANEVMETVRDWLAYLASSVEVDVALTEFKRRVEAGNLPVTDERSAGRAIADYFSKSLPAQAAIEHDLARGVRADVVLRFAERLVVIEVKFLRGGHAWGRIGQDAQQLQFLMAKAKADRGALVVFNHGSPQPGRSHLATLAGGKVSIISVQLPSSTV